MNCEKISKQQQDVTRRGVSFYCSASSRQVSWLKRLICQYASQCLFPLSPAACQVEQLKLHRNYILTLFEFYATGEFFFFIS